MASEGLQKTLLGFNSLIKGCIIEKTCWFQMRRSNGGDSFDKLVPPPIYAKEEEVEARAEAEEEMGKTKRLAAAAAEAEAEVAALALELPAAGGGPGENPPGSHPRGAAATGGK